jgi:hypothetical protein
MCEPENEESLSSVQRSEKFIADAGQSAGLKKPLHHDGFSFTADAQLIPFRVGEFLKRSWYDFQIFQAEDKHVVAREIISKLMPPSEIGSTKMSEGPKGDVVFERGIWIVSNTGRLTRLPMLAPLPADPLALSNRKFPFGSIANGDH